MLAKKITSVFAFCLLTAGLHAEGLGSPDPTGSPGPQQSRGDASSSSRRGLNRNDLNSMRYRDATGKWSSRTTELSNQGVASVPKMREQLAKEWQSLGIPAEQATIIASAYRGSDGRLTDTGLLKGKSASEAAAMMQSALASKDYRQANQLLIEYERNKLNLEQVDASQSGPR
ncbi:hypothetical protein J7I44_09435 [Frateuria sp. MAH-13]|uniref:Uncharacterized protein n=1 Tax=Frateuria flava TaxID=2821489 RepID=A0ABS4DND6_9GAMM|nr:hypothetical protein [Frateuria flava]MBP1474525.1 hypothetical protein [Frateuria flava]